MTAKSRRALLSLLAVLLVCGAGWVWQEREELAAFPTIISAYTAKEYCSCRYVMQQPASYCEGYVKQYVPATLSADDAAKRVVAWGMGHGSTAQWVGQRQGCQLVSSPQGL